MSVNKLNPAILGIVCPCRIADSPCDPDCTCVKPFMSTGCMCCPRYGSKEQRIERANTLVAMVKEYETLKERLHKCDGLANEVNILTKEVRPLELKLKMALNILEEIACRSDEEMKNAKTLHYDMRGWAAHTLEQISKLPEK